MAHNTFVSKVNNKDCLINSQRILNWIFLWRLIRPQQWRSYDDGGKATNGICFVLIALESDLDGHPKPPTDAKQQFTAI